jgi:hypothetical protein
MTGIAANIAGANVSLEQIKEVRAYAREREVSIADRELRTLPIAQKWSLKLLLPYSVYRIPFFAPLLEETNSRQNFEHVVSQVFIRHVQRGIDALVVAKAL